MYKKLILILILLIVPLSLAQVNFSVNFSFIKGGILIKISDKGYSDNVEFYKGKYFEGADPIQRFIGTVPLNCNNVANCEARIAFSQIGTGIFEPGDYYFVIWDAERKNAVRKDFTLSQDYLLSCDYNGTLIKNNQCAGFVTNNIADRPYYCSEGEIISSCSYPGFCGCPSNNQICCTNENLEECKGKIGECVSAGEERFEEEIIIEEGEQEIILQEQLGCNYPGYSKKIGSGICSNSVFGLVEENVFPKDYDPLFSSYCECTLLANEFDKDGDGYDDIIFTGGIDCNDANENINPAATESCEAETGYDNIDNNCDGIADLRCDSFCDKDLDNYASNNLCLLAGYKVDDCRDDNANINPGMNEICDGIDNNCNNEIDEIGCQCRLGQRRTGSGICIRGEEVCNELGRWVADENNPPINTCDPAVIIYGYDAGQRIEVPSGVDIAVVAGFVCQDANGCGNVDINIK
ncbi:putative metal-binding motif-containing protein [Candidatus Woesearchaeota archaeon]|nr:putative metal-binding motif-containing protein [Candidatus Woesearchaeota archaeon]